MNSEDNHLMETIKAVIVPIHKAGWPFIAGFMFVSFILGMMWNVLGWIGFVFTAWCVYFFRDPERITPRRPGIFVAPADGVIQKIVKIVPPAELDLGDAERTRISIFLNVFDVHVNRIPVDGTVTRLHYYPGKFLNANLDKASEENERQYIRIAMADGNQVGVVQIAGLVARRILCDLKENDVVKAGDRFGLIRFGSRTDIYLPVGAEVLVLEGQRAVGAETVLAKI